MNVLERAVAGAERALEWRARFEVALGTPFVGGNRLRVLRNGIEIFPAMLDAIDHAETSIELLTFVYWRGDIARRFAAALSQRAAAGVDVKVLLDALGASQMDQGLIEEMRESGADVQWFRPKKSMKVWKLDQRTHRKVLVCDDLVAFTGGVGIASEWEGDARDPSEWRETHFEVRGPAVRLLRGGFYTNWEETGAHTYPVEPVRRVEQAGDVWLQVVLASSSVHWNDIATLLRTSIASARRSLRITTAYFVPDDVTMQLLIDAARRGVHVELLLPGPHIDHRVSELAAEAHFEPLLEAGVEIWIYQRTMLHAKLMTIDGEVAVLGSANFNHRSMLKDEELCLVTTDRATIELLDRHFEEDRSHAERRTVREQRRRGPWQRVKELLVLPAKQEL